MVYSVHIFVKKFGNRTRIIVVVTVFIVHVSVVRIDDKRT